MPHPTPAPSAPAMPTAPGRATAPVAAGGTTTRIIRSWDEYAALEAPWQELIRAADAMPFVQHCWFLVWRDVFGSEAEPRIATAWRDGQLVAAAPMGFRRRPLSSLLPGMQVDALETLSNPQTGAMIQWLFAPGHEDAAADLLRGLREQAGPWQIAFMQPLPDDGAYAALLCAARELDWPTIETHIGNSVTADLSPGYEGFLKTKSRKWRSNFRRYVNRLKEHEHRMILADGHDPDFPARVYAVTEKSWKARAGTAMAHAPDEQAFWTGVWKHFGPTGEMEMRVFEVDGDDAASVISVYNAARGYCLKIDFDETWKDLSPGRHIIAAHLKASAARGCTVSDFLRENDFLSSWADGSYRLMRLRLFPGATWAARACQLEERLRPIGRRWRHAWRQQRRKRAAYKDQ